MQQITSLSQYINEQFPSDYLTGDDIGSATVLVVIKSFEMKIVDNPKKRKKQPRLVLYFRDKDKGLVVAKTRAQELKMLFGDNPQNLIGKEIMLYTKREQSFGEIKNIIHIRSKDLVPDYVPPEGESNDEEEVRIEDIPL